MDIQIGLPQNYSIGLRFGMRTKYWPNPLLTCSPLRVIAIGIFIVVALPSLSAQTRRQSIARKSVPNDILLRILKAEDERRWDASLSDLLSNSSPEIRKRAALAVGRIGNENSIPALSQLLKKDTENEVRAMAAFALGEVESAAGASLLVEVVKDTAQPTNVTARAIEALGKIGAALPKEQVSVQRELAGVILSALQHETLRNSNREIILLGLTAVLRSHPTGAGPTVALFLKHGDSRVRADAANVLARLRLQDGNDQLRSLLKEDSDPIVRANAARVLGATEDKRSVEFLLASAIGDTDARVRVSAIRALATLKDTSVVKTLLERGIALTQRDLRERPVETNEVLEIATTLGRLLPASENQDALNWLRVVRNALENTAPEAEIAYAQIWPSAYVTEFGEGPIGVKALQRKFLLNWRTGAAIAAGLAEVANVSASMKGVDELKKWATELLDGMLNYRKSDVKINTLLPTHTDYGIPEVLRAYAAFRPRDLPAVLRDQINENDVIIRATAADLIGDLPASDTNTRALSEALPRASHDDLNDAVLSILDSLAKQKTASANQVIKGALDSEDYLVRRRAVSLLKANGAGDYSSRIGTVKTPNKLADYRRALARIGKKTRAVVTTSKGSFTIELLPAEATLTVDNFVQLAQRGYFRGITIHRVVPNFVIQDGDPRGDGNGGPGYQIRCEINEMKFDRGAVGMALSGKDTGGSQWFVTHSPSPHLDGGYTVFGQVVEGMDVVDKIVRGDIIKYIDVGPNGRQRR